jgi:GTP-binding protein
VIDAPNENVGSVMELVGGRKGEMKKMEPRGDTVTHMKFEIPSRALIGLRGRVLTATQGEAIMHHSLPALRSGRGEIPHRQQGVLISPRDQPGHDLRLRAAGRPRRAVREPGDKVYTGQIVGEHNRDNDLTVNITRLKHLTNMRAASKEATVVLKAPRKLSLEPAMEYIEDDELVEVTPKSDPPAEEDPRREHAQAGRQGRERRVSPPAPSPVPPGYSRADARGCRFPNQTPVARV